MEFLCEFSKNSNAFKEAKKVRDQIFVIEDNTTPEEEYDELDKLAYHIVGYLNDQPICCARLIKKSTNNFYVGRVGVLKQYRGKTIGVELMEYVVDYVKNNLKEDVLYLNARMYAFNFYKRLGFESIGESFFEIGIEHIKMFKNL